MTKQQAIKSAKRASKAFNEVRYVIYDPSCGQLLCESYFVSTSFNLDTFFAGLEPVYCTDE